MSAPFQPNTDGKTLLKDLEDIMLFDQSTPSKWPRIAIYVESSGAVESDNDAALMVYPNGRTYSLERAHDVVVPPEVIDALHAAQTARMVPSKQSSGIGYESKNVMRFPFRVIDGPSQKRYDKWKEALDVLRYVVTETKKKRHATLDKDVYEVTARYIPSEFIDKARDLVQWARDEVQFEKDRAAELRAAAA